MNFRSPSEEQYPTNRINRPGRMTEVWAVMPLILNRWPKTPTEVARGRLTAREGWMKAPEPVYGVSKVGWTPFFTVNVIGGDKPKPAPAIPPALITNTNHYERNCQRQNCSRL